MNSHPASRAAQATRSYASQTRALIGSNPEAREQFEEAPDADPHSVFVPGPVRHVRQQHLAGRRRQHLPRHRPRDVPEFEIDDGPDDEPSAVREDQRRPVDNRRISAAFTRDHRDLEKD